VLIKSKKYGGGIRLRIFFLSGDIKIKDEGMMSVLRKYIDGLRDKHDVLYGHARKMLTREFWRNLEDFEPDVIHCVLRPCVSVLVILGLLKLKCKNSKIILSALQPPLNKRFVKIFTKFYKPDLVLVSSERTKVLFESYGCTSRILIGGVDLEKFKPSKNKLYFRKKYNLSESDYVVLHVGHINRGRNIQALKRIQELRGVQVLIIGSTAFKPDPNLIEDLKEAGCIVHCHYFENIEEIYNASDCYVFPTLDESKCVEIPLSVLEALAVNIPVVTTPFGGLPQILSAGEGLFFVEKTEDFTEIISRLKNSRMIIKTREKVKNLTWENTICLLESIYHNCTEGKL